MKATAAQQDIAKHPSLFRLSRLRPNPLGFKPASDRLLAVVPAQWTESVGPVMKSNFGTLPAQKLAPPRAEAPTQQYSIPEGVDGKIRSEIPGFLTGINSANIGRGYFDADGLRRVYGSHALRARCIAVNAAPTRS